MDGNLLVVTIIGCSTVGWIATSWIRARHGYPVENEWGDTVSREDGESRSKITDLTAENAELTDRLVRMERRVAVLERIATDNHAPARLASEIDALK